MLNKKRRLEEVKDSDMMLTTGKTDNVIRHEIHPVKHRENSISLNVYFFFKPLLDILLSVLLFVILSPVFLLITFLVLFSMGRPIFFTQKRVGKNGRIFKIYKFRTMLVDNSSKAKFASVNDNRITALGKILRKYRLDELPQLVNILKNDMSLIGPRPEQVEFNNLFLNEIKSYKKRLKVKPGITGYAQVYNGYSACSELTKKKLKYDIMYIRKISFLFDLKILLITVYVVLTGFGHR
jgi:lipopolysaccharide/colanic/teichoic acid biosynthesis glycosyltransferase